MEDEFSFNAADGEVIDVWTEICADRSGKLWHYCLKMVFLNGPLRVNRLNDTKENYSYYLLHLQSRLLLFAMLISNNK